MCTCSKYIKIVRNDDLFKLKLDLQEKCLSSVSLIPSMLGHARLAASFQPAGAVVPAVARLVVLAVVRPVVLAVAHVDPAEVRVAHPALAAGRLKYEVSSGLAAIKL